MDASEGDCDESESPSLVPFSPTFTKCDRGSLSSVEKPESWSSLEALDLPDEDLVDEESASALVLPSLSLSDDRYTTVGVSEYSEDSEGIFTINILHNYSAEIFHT